MDYTSFLLQMVVTLFLSLLVGIERQWHKRAAGIRTNVLVCLGAFLFASAPIITGKGDSLRMASQVISGIGFLGAGVVIKDGANIRGLNTAATLWCNAAIGVLCALGLMIEAAIGALIILIVNIVIRYITRKVDKITSKSQYYILNIVLDRDKETILRTTLIQSIGEAKLKVSGMRTKDHGEKIEIVADVILNGDASEAMEQIITRFSMEPGVYYIGYKKNEEYEDN